LVGVVGRPGATNAAGHLYSKPFGAVGSLGSCPAVSVVQSPKIRALLGLPPGRKAHRPKGSTSTRRDLEAYALAELRDGLGVKHVPLLRALGRDPERRGPDRGDTANVKWLRRRLPSSVETRP